MTPAPGWVGVQLQPDASATVVEKALRAETAVDETRSSVRYDKQRILLLPVEAQAAEPSRERLRARLAGAASLRRSLRVFHNGKLPPAVETDEFVIQFKPGVTRQAAANLLASFGAVIVQPLGSYARNGYLARLKDATSTSTLTVANALYEKPEVIFSHPNFIWPKQKRFIPNDTLYTQQWHLNNTGQGGGTAGADIKAVAGWDLSRGSASITIAILDDGVDLDHEDLQGKLVPGYDFVDNDSNPRPGSGDDHGTSCAGVAAANGHNGLGVTGAAPGCKLMPVRMLGAASTTQTEANALRFAADHGADVISNSWGPPDGGSVNYPLPDVVKAAIDYATTSGRGGKGCVILWAAGNGTESADLDGYASYERVISVAASTNQDQHASYSDFGSSVDICAPSNGGTLGITTTDRTGSPGYSSTNYTGDFGGTSSATPLAAGVAALVLSVDPGLTYIQVRQRLQATADKIDVAGGAYNASGHSAQYGYGRINVQRALTGLSRTPYLLFQSQALNDSAGNNNGSAEPDESVALTVVLVNQGGVAATGVSATLASTTPGVTVVQASSPYANIAAAATGANSTPYRFSVASSVVCGTVLNFTLNVTTNEARFALPLRVTTGTTQTNQSFLDTMESGAANWTHNAASGLDTWTLGTNANARSTPHAWTCTNSATVTDQRLVLKAVTVPSGINQRLRFWHTYNFESGYDGAVLEISTNGGTTYTDLGSKLLSGAYSGMINSAYGNPLAGRSAWTGGVIGAMQEVAVDLSSYAGQSVLLRWRVGTDNGVPAPGWSVDDVRITSELPVCGGNACPVLDWTSEAGYTVDGVNPDTGSGATSFTFRALYTDADNDAPVAFLLHLKKDGSAITGSPFVMQSTGDTSYTSGSIYTRTVSGLAAGSYAYYFTVSDGSCDATGAPALAQTGLVVAGVQPSLSINDVSVAEGDSGTTQAIFTVGLSSASSQTVTVSYATANGTATAGSDYAAKSGAVTFAPGATSQTVAVTIYGDAVAEGDETFFVNLSNPVNATLPATQAIGRILNDDAAPLNVSLAPANSSRIAGLSNTYTSKYSDPNGIADITEARILFNSTLNGANALQGLYLPATNKLYLRDNANGAWLGGFAPLSNNVISNSQGSLNCALTTVGGNGNTLTINWSFTPAASWMGGRYIYMQVRDKTNLVDGWERMGTVQIVANKAPVNQSVTPGSGSSAAGTAYTLAAKHYDENGSTDIVEARLLVNSAATGAGALMSMYVPATNKLYLRDNTNGSWLGGFAPGSANVISNSQGSLNCAATSVNFGAQILTINWSFTPAASFAGTRNLYLLARDRSNAVDGLDQLGIWTITGSTTRTVSPASPVMLSSATALVSSQSVLLSFTGALDAKVANDAARYEVQVNGVTVPVQSAAYNVAGNSVTLGLSLSALRVGDRVVVCWNELRDKNGAALSGCSETLTAR